MDILKWFFKGIGYIIKKCISLAINLILIAILIIVVLKYFLGSEKIISNVKEGSYLAIDFSNNFSEKRYTSPIPFQSNEINFYGLLKQLKRAIKDKRIKGIILQVDSMSLNRAQIEEVGKVIEDIKNSGKKVYSYSINFDNAGYSLAVRGDKIFMPPTSSANVFLTGYFKATPYYAILANQFGIKMNVIQIGDYKSYGEEYTRDEMSPELKENTERMLNLVYENFISNVSQHRGVSEKLLNERILEGDFVVSEPFNMAQYGLIDDTKYYNQFLKDENIDVKNIITLEDYLTDYELTQQLEPENKIAIIYAEGDINYYGDSKNIVGTITPEMMINELEKVEEDASIKGVVIRINSPGGSALASDIIWHRIKDMNKPVYISIGGMAASGGYYISSAADKIFADKESITGSIGVVSMIPNIQEFLENIEINVSTIEKGKYAGIYSMINKFTPEDREKIYASNYKVYNEFLDRVSTSRNIDKEELHKIAQGKVWLGQEAVNIGLVDSIGGLQETIQAMAKNLDLKEYSIYEEVQAQPINQFVSNYIGIISKLNKMSLEGYLKNELFFKPVLYYPYGL